MLKNHAGFMKRALLTMLAGVFSSAAMPLDIYQGPMVAERSMDPNLLYIYDDSGSMAWDYMPDEAPSGGNNRRVAFLNKQYYNPDITYQPPVTYVSGRLVSWGNMDRRCVWPRVMNDGFTGTPNVCGATTTLTATTALYYDYIPGFNSRIDNQVDYTWEPIVMIDGKPYVGGRPIATGENALTTLNWAGAPENNANNYERYAFTTIPSGAKFRVGGTSTAGSSLVNATGTIVDNRACPVLFKDVVESRAYYNDYAKFPGQPGASDEFKGNPHAQCRYSYRTGDVDYQSNYQNYTSTAPYSGATVAGNIYGRVWCDRDGGSTNFTSLAQTRTCVMGKHVIGDTTGAGTLQTSANNNPVWDYTKYSSGVAPNSSTRKDHSLEHRVSKFVNDDGSLRTEPVPRVRTAGEEIRNFANWYSYYRTRSLAARSGTALAFANLVDSNDTTQPNVAMRGKVIRLGYDTINRITSTGPGQRSGAVTTVGRGVVPFIDNDPNYPGKRFVEDFYNWVKALPASGGTQLARALRYTGDYLENGNKKPWYEYPPDTYNGTPKGEVFGCRRSFAILMTDGYYTDTNSVGDADGTNGPVIWKTDKDNKNLTTDPKNSYQYRPEPPFFGQYAGYTVSNYLADVAMYFWKRDLQPGIPNLITPTKKDPAFWQHMQTFTIGLGVMGRMSDTEVNDFLSKGTKKNILWTFPSGLDTDYEHIDDLMHAGLNGHAGTSAAEDAGEFVGKLTQLLTEISGQDGSNTSPAVPRGLSNDSLAFEASYSPADWTGELVAKKICQPGVVDPDCSASDKKASAQKTKWGAQALLAERVAIKGHADRRIFTRDGSSAVTFDTGLPSSVKTAIDVDLNHSAGLPVMENCVMARPTLGNPPTGDVCTLRGSAAASVPYNVDHLINYLRGDSIYEDTTTGATVNYNGFRKRSYVNASGVKEMKLLGDIVNSSPDLITNRTIESNFDQATALGASTNPLVPASGYAASYLLRKKAFTKYKDDIDGGVVVGVKPAREETVLVGAGDGMLHAFDEKTGQEQFAYIPKAVHPILKKLADPQYSQIDTLKHSFYVDGATVNEDIVRGGNWATVAVGSTGRSDGGSSYFALNVEKASTFGAGDALWEFSDAELGVPGNGRAEIALLPDGKWYALFGNGYGSASGRAGLFLVDINSGVAKFIDTLTGDGSTPNGLGTPSFVNFGMSDMTIEPGSSVPRGGTAPLAYAGDLLGNVWKFDLVNKTAEKLLVATDAGGNPLPITAPPRLILVENDGGTTGVQVIVGTGKFLEQSDVENTDVQTIYSVRDNCGITVGCTPSTATRSALFKFENIVSKIDYKVTQGFYLDLTGKVNVEGLLMDLKGSRVIDKGTEALKEKSAQIEVPFMLPSVDPCASAVEGFNLELDAVNGRITKALYEPKGENSVNVSLGFGVSRSGFAGLTPPISGGVNNGVGRSDGSLDLTDKDHDRVGGGKCVWTKNPETGNLECIEIASSEKRGRQSWRQIR